MKHIKSYQNGVVIGSFALIVSQAFVGCEQKEEASINQNKFIIVKQLPTGKYQVIEETPINGPTRIMVQSNDGTMRELSEAEMHQLAEEEYRKVQQGTSETTQANNEGGMGLGGTILAVAAGSILGNMIANSLMGNRNFSHNNRSMSAHARSVNRANTAAKKSSAKRGFFGKSGSSSHRSGGFFGG